MGSFLKDLHHSASMHRHATILAALVFVAFVRPFLGASEGSLGVTDVVLFLLLLGAATTPRVAGKTVWPVLLAATATLLSLALRTATESEEAGYALILSYITFLSLVAWRVACSLLAPQKRVTVDMVSGALAVYLILGLIWALAFLAVETTHPGTFIFATGESGVDAGFWRFLGFSFATLTTLGYGNVAPATAQGDAIAGLEAVVGQLYMAVVIARIVALHIAQADRPTEHDEAM
jgi:hypothetical protein